MQFDGTTAGTRSYRDDQIKASWFVLVTGNEYFSRIPCRIILRSLTIRYLQFIE